MINLSKKATEQNGGNYVYHKFCDLPDINIISNREAYITGIKGIKEYTQDFIRLDCGHLSVTVKGYCLNMTAISFEEVMIKGEIVGVEFSCCKR